MKIILATWMEDSQSQVLNKEKVFNRLLSFAFLNSLKDKETLRKYVNKMIESKGEVNENK